MSIEKMNFKRWVHKVLPAVYDESLSYYELLCKVIAKLNETIDLSNGTAEALKELQDYVANYFDNLDVQEEINNKLDEMAESGQLTDIIAQYLQLAGVLAYNTKAQMKTAENLVDGSIAKTLGNTTYQDGQGAFYKIRQIQNTDVIDDNNIIALHDTNLVAEKIQYSSGYDLQNQINSNDNDIELLNNKINPFNANLENILYYDTNSTAYLQGCCVDNNNIMYIYEENNFPYGDLIKINISTGAYVERIQNIKLYHANDMTIIDNKIYVATCKDENNLLRNKKIAIYDLTNNTTTEINPFENESSVDCIFGITKYNDTKLLCALTYNSEQRLDFVKLFLYDITTQNIQEIEITNTKNLQTNFWGAFQSIEYKENKLYFLTSVPNNILEFNIEDNNADFNLIYNLGEIDTKGQPYNEFEGIAIIPSNLYGNDTFVVYSNATLYETKKHTIQAYLINFKNNTPKYLKSNLLETNSYINRRNVCIVNNTSQHTYENGSTTYPFKTLTRAINFINMSKYANTYNGRIVINGGNNYEMPSFTNKNFNIRNETSGNVTINFTQQLMWNTDCKFSFDGVSNRFILNFPGGLVLDECQLKLNKCDIIYTGTNNIESLISETGLPSRFFSTDCTANGNNHVQYIFRADNGGYNQFHFTTGTNLTTNYYYRTVSQSFNIVPYDQNDKWTPGSNSAIVILSNQKITS
jgi:hypothetical protein